MTRLVAIEAAAKVLELEHALERTRESKLELMRKDGCDPLVDRAIQQLAREEDKLEAQCIILRAVGSSAVSTDQVEATDSLVTQDVAI